jgi:threonine aldolase
VIFEVKGVQDPAPLLARLKQRGVLAGTAAAHQIRFVTHNDVNRDTCEQAAQIVREVIGS